MNRMEEGSGSEQSIAAYVAREGDTVTVDTELERTTEFYVAGDGLLHASTSSTDGVTVTRVYVNGKRLTDVPEELFELVMDGLYDEGYTS